MNVRHLVTSRTQQAQDRLSTLVTRIGAVHEARAAVTRARDEGGRLLATLGQLPTVASMRNGVQARSTRIAERVAAARAFGNTARTDVWTAAAEVRASAKRILSPPAPAPESKPEPADDRQAIAQ